MRTGRFFEIERGKEHEKHKSHKRKIFLFFLLIIRQNCPKRRVPETIDHLG
jgi:hypothetical protein